MTFYSLLAIFPALAALVAIYGLFSDPAAITGHLDQVSGFMPSGAIDVARDQLTRVASKGHQTLGFTFAIGLGVFLWSANAAMKSLFDTLNIVYAEQEKRGFIKLNAVSLTFTAAAVAFALLPSPPSLSCRSHSNILVFQISPISCCASSGGQLCSSRSRFRSR